MAKFKFKYTSDGLTDFTRTMDYAKLNPFFNSDYVANSNNAQDKIDYVYGMAYINTLPKFAQDDFDEDTYNSLNGQDPIAGFNYLAYKAMGQKDKEDDANYSALAEHYAKLNMKDEMSSGERFWAGVEDMGKDVWYFALDLVDTGLDALPSFYVMIEGVGQSTARNRVDSKLGYGGYDAVNKGQVDTYNNVESWIKNDTWLTWATGGKTIDELKYENRLDRFYRTNQFDSIEDAMSGFQLGEDVNLGNTLDLLGSASSSFAEMSFNFIGPEVYWGYTASKMAKDSIKTVDDPYVRIAQWGSQFAIEYATEMIFADSFIDTGLIKTDKWLPTNLTGASRLFAKMGIDAGTNAVEEMASEILDTLSNQILYSTFSKFSELSANDTQALDADWGTLVKRTLTSGLVGGLVGAMGVLGSLARTNKIALNSDNGESIVLGKLSSWSVDSINEAIALFADKDYAKRQVIDEMSQGRELSEEELTNIYDSQAYKTATEIDAKNNEAFVAGMNSLATMLAKKGYADSDSIALTVASAFQDSATYYANFTNNSYTYTRSNRNVSTSSKISQVNLQAEKAFAMRYADKANIVITNSSFIDPSLKDLSANTGFNGGIFIGTIGAKRVPSSPYTVIGDTLYIDSAYYYKEGGLGRGKVLREAIATNISSALANETIFEARNSQLYTAIIRAMQGGYGSDKMSYTDLIDKVGIEEARKQLIDALIKSPLAMRMVFTSRPREFKGFIDALKKVRLNAIKTYGKNAESKMMINSEVIAIINSATAGLTTDIGTFNKSLQNQLKKLQLDLPIDKKLDFISNAISLHKNEIEKYSTEPDMWLLRDMGFLQKKKTEVKTPVLTTSPSGELSVDYEIQVVPVSTLRSSVMNYFVQSGLKAIAYSQQDLSLGDSVANSNLSDIEVATAILQNTEVKHYLGITNTNFRNNYIAHLMNIIRSDAVNDDVRLKTFAELQVFVQYTFALSDEATKKDIGAFMSKAHSDFMQYMQSTETGTKNYTALNNIKITAEQLANWKLPFDITNETLGVQAVASALPSLFANTKSINACVSKIFRTDDIYNTRYSLAGEINDIIKGNNEVDTTITSPLALAIRKTLGLDKDVALKVKTEKEASSMIATVIRSLSDKIAHHKTITSLDIASAVGDATGIFFRVSSDGNSIKAYALADFGKYYKYAFNNNAVFYRKLNSNGTLSTAKLSDFFNVDAFIDNLKAQGVYKAPTLEALKTILNKQTIGLVAYPVDGDKAWGTVKKDNGDWKINLLLPESGVSKGVSGAHLSQVLMHEVAHLVSSELDNSTLSSDLGFQKTLPASVLFDKILEGDKTLTLNKYLAMDDSARLKLVSALDSMSGKSQDYIKAVSDSITALANIEKNLKDNNTNADVALVFYGLSTAELVAESYRPDALTKNLVATDELSRLVLDYQTKYDDVIRLDIRDEQANSLAKTFSESNSKTLADITQLVANRKLKLTKDEIIFLNEVNTIRGQILQLGDGNNDRSIYVKNIIGDISTKASTLDSRQLHNYLAKQISIFKALGGLTTIVNKLSDTKIVEVTESVASIAERKAVEVARKEATSQEITKPNNYIIGRKLSKKDIDGGLVKYRLVSTNNPKEHLAITSIVSQGGYTADGSYIPAQVYVKSYVGSRTKLNSKEFGNFRIRGIDATISPTLEKSIKLTTDAMRNSIGSLRRSFNINDPVRSKNLIYLDDSVKNRFVSEYHGILNAYAELLKDTQKIRTEDGVRKYLPIANKRAGEISKMAEDLLTRVRIEMNSISEAQDKQNRLNTEEKRAEWAKQKLALADELAKIRAENLDGRIEALENKRAEILELQNKDKLTADENVAEVIKESEANSFSPEWELLNNLLLKKITSKEELRDYIKNSDDKLTMLNRYMKFTAESHRENANIRLALDTVFADSEFNRSTVESILKEEQALAKDEVNANNDAHAIIKFLRKFDKLDLANLYTNEVSWNELKLTISDLLDRMEDNGSSVAFEDEAEGSEIYNYFGGYGLATGMIDHILNHNRYIYDLDGNLTEVGSDLMDFLNVGIADDDSIFKDTISRDEANARFRKATDYVEKVSANLQPYHLDESQVKYFDKFSKDIAHDKRLNSKQKSIALSIATVAGKARISDVLTATNDYGISKEMVYSTSPSDFFRDTLHPILDTMADSDWKAVMDFYQHQFANKALPALVVSNMLNLVNYFTLRYRNGVLDTSSQDIKSAYNNARLIKEQVAHLGGLYLAKAKEAKNILNDMGGTGNAPKGFSQGIIDFYRRYKNLTLEQASAEAKNKLEFKMNLQLFANKYVEKKDMTYNLNEAITNSKTTINDDITADNAESVLYELLKESSIFTDLEGYTMEQQIKDVLAGKKTLSDDDMAELWDVAEAHGQWRVLGYIQDLYQKRANEIVGQVKVRDIFNRSSPEARKEAWRALVAKVTSFRFLAMLSNASVAIKNEVTNFLNVRLDKSVISPLTTKLFAGLNKSLGDKIVMKNESTYIRDANGEYATFAYNPTADSWEKGESTSNKYKAMTYSLESAKEIMEQMPELGLSTDTSAYQYNLSSAKVKGENSDRAKEVVRNMFIDSGFLEYQQRGQTSFINKDVLDKYIKRATPYSSDTKVGKILSGWHDFMYKVLEGSDYRYVKELMVSYLENLADYTKMYDMPHTPYGASLEGLTKEEIQTRKNDDFAFQLEMSKMVKLAFISSLEVVYKSNNKLFRTIEGLYADSPLAKLIGSVILPFPKVSSNILIQIGKYSPFGLGGFVFKALNLRIFGKEVVEGDINAESYLTGLAKDGIKGAVGTALYALGFLLAGVGALRVDPEKDYHGVVVYFGDTAIDLSNVSALAYPMLLGASLNSMADLDKDAMESFVEELNVLSFLGNIVETFQSYSVSDIPTEMIETYVLSYIPSVLKTAYRVFDPYEKDYSGMNIATRTVMRAFPFFAPNKIDPYTGDYKKRYRANLFGVVSVNDLLNYISPIPVYMYYKSDAERLADENDVTVNNRSTKKVSFDGVDGKMSQEQLREYNTVKAKTFATMVEDLVKTQEWKSANKEKKAELLETIKGRSSEIAKVNLWLATNKTNAYLFTKQTDFTIALRKYIKNPRIRQVANLPTRKSGSGDSESFNYYGSW